MKLVSTMTQDYWPGLKVLAHSLKHKGGISDLDWIILTSDGQVPDEWYEWLNKCGFNLVSKAFFQVGQEYWPDKLAGTRPRLAINWNKLRVLLLPPGEYIFLDADLLCVNQCADLLYTKAISGGPQMANRPEFPGIELGLFRIDSDPAIFLECMDIMREKEWWAAAEQSVLAEYLVRHPEKLHMLPYWVDMLNYLAIRAPNMWQPDKAIFIHFAGDVKPWQGTVGQENIVPPECQGTWNKVSDIWRDYAREVL